MMGLFVILRILVLVVLAIGIAWGLSKWWDKDNDRHAKNCSRDCRPQDD